MAAQKIGEGHAEAMLRLGFKELRNAVNPSRESVADTEIGLYGTRTQGEIAQERGSYQGQDADQEPVRTHQHAGATSEQFKALREGRHEAARDDTLAQRIEQERQGREMEGRGR